MSIKRSVSLLAAVSVSALACGATPTETSASSGEAVKIKPHPICLSAQGGGASTQLIWTGSTGTVDSTVVFYPRAWTSGDYSTYAGVEPGGDVDYIVWVANEDVPGFEAVNYVCSYGVKPMGGAGVEPPPPPPDHRICVALVVPPVDAPCVSDVEEAAFPKGLRASCNTPVWTRQMCDSGFVSLQGLGGNCLDVQNANPMSTVVDDAVCTAGNLAQRFQFNWDGTITNYWGYCLDVLSDDTNAGVLDFTTCNGTAAQVWRRQGAQIVGPAGKCLDVLYGNPNPATRIDLATCNGTPSQDWRITSPL